MKAMILSAGFGTRLQHLTKETPKALVRYKDIPMINYQIERLKNAGVDEIIVNAHHHKEKILRYFSENNFDVKINVILENEILGTGGGILNAEKYFNKENCFIVINADIDTDMNLSDMISFHDDNKPFATLAVQKRKTTKYLEFDTDMNLMGRENENSKQSNLYAFNGIHVISRKIFRKGIEVRFSGILDIYFEAIKNDKDLIKGFNSEGSFFKDLGKTGNL